ncbi:zinc metallopeptidase [Aliikangiella sp. G2MR2-5]|uniref:zinc metallopeptidase n=1 Tax=Aliikangiella sp. G2MR2-5 TaxID=2788943 RepID=UPI0018A8AFA4|nr:zinc metallopeptidase [Aliikangiella sp. G2MR2-5]
MGILIVVLLLLALILAPQWWVRFVLRRYDKQLEGMPGTGGELARHLLDRFDLKAVGVEVTEEGSDHYDPEENMVRLSPGYLNGKSLTAVAVAAHEVGHAIQFNKNEPVSWLRKKYLPKAIKMQRIGASILVALPLIAVIIKVPHLMVITGLTGLAVLFSSVFAYAAILPEEWDASFNKALPILEEGEYIPDIYLPVVRRILKACALTYVAAALADVLRLWRWLALLKMIR